MLPLFRSAGSIKPNPQNLRTCEDCHAIYCINGDESGYWLCGDGAKMIIDQYDVFGKCEFCKPTGKYSLTNYQTSGIVE